MATLIYGFTSLDVTDGNSLKEIDGALLNDGDMAMGIYNTRHGFYQVDADSGASESLPDIVSPTSNAGTKRWLLKGYISADITLNNTTASLPVWTDASKKLETKSVAETKTILGTNAATTSATGVVELATNAEALTGTDTASAVTPDDLKYGLDRRIQQYYGVSWDENADTYVRTGSTAGQTCGVTLADAFLPVHRRLIDVS